MLSAARKDLTAQLDVVRKEMARLAGEEKELSQALDGLGPRAGSSPARAKAPAAGKRTRRASAAGASKRSTAGRARSKRRSTPVKSNAERVEELREALAAGPKSLKELGAGLGVSPQRVRQLLDDLGSSVSSAPNPEKPGKLWSLDGATTNRASGTGTTSPAAAGKAKPRTTRKTQPRKRAAAK